MKQNRIPFLRLSGSFLQNKAKPKLPFKGQKQILATKKAKKAKKKSDFRIGSNSSSEDYLLVPLEFCQKGTNAKPFKGMLWMNRQSKF
jgi:hypothetical protein